MNGNREITIEDIKYLNALGFAQLVENSWFFTKLGYVFDFSSTDLSYIPVIWENRLVSPICWNLEHWISENQFWNS